MSKDLREGDVILLGPYSMWKRRKQKDAPAYPELQPPNPWDKESNMIPIRKGMRCTYVAVVRRILENSVLIEPHYVVWDDRVDTSDQWHMRDKVILEKDSMDYELLEIADRERDNTDAMLGWLLYQAQHEGS